MLLPKVGGDRVRIVLRNPNLCCDRLVCDLRGERQQWNVVQPLINSLDSIIKTLWRVESLQLHSLQGGKFADDNGRYLQ